MDVQYFYTSCCSVHQATLFSHCYGSISTVVTVVREAKSFHTQHVKCVHWGPSRSTGPSQVLVHTAFLWAKMLPLLRQELIFRNAHRWNVSSFISYLQVRFLSGLQLMPRHRVKSFIASFIVWSMNCKWIEFCHVWWKITPRNTSSALPFGLSSGRFEW